MLLYQRETSPVPAKKRKTTLDDYFGGKGKGDENATKEVKGSINILAFFLGCIDIVGVRLA
jgi:hypothetical protein